MVKTRTEYGEIDTDDMGLFVDDDEFDGEPTSPKTPRSRSGDPQGGS